MLELPESYSIARQINTNLKGKVIRQVETGHTPHRFAFYKGDSTQYQPLLVGKTIEKAEHKGGQIEIDTADSMIVLGDGASPRYWESVDEIPDKRQLLITFEDDSAITVTIAMYGEMGLFPLGSCEDPYYAAAVSKPDPLSDAFTYEYFKGLYQDKGKKMTVKTFLATEQRIPGLGNGVLQDILWQAGLDPRYDMKQLTEAEFQRLYEAVKKTLRDMCLQGGRNTEKDFLGNAGGYITQLSKLTLGKPCPKCGHIIQKANYMGGTIYFCEQCQRRG